MICELYLNKAVLFLKSYNQHRQSVYCLWPCPCPSSQCPPTPSLCGPPSVSYQFNKLILSVYPQSSHNNMNLEAREPSLSFLRACSFSWLSKFAFVYFRYTFEGFKEIGHSTTQQPSVLILLSLLLESLQVERGNLFTLRVGFLLLVSSREAKDIDLGSSFLTEFGTYLWDPGKMT